MYIQISGVDLFLLAESRNVQNLAKFEMIPCVPVFGIIRYVDHIQEKIITCWSLLDARKPFL